MSSFSASVSNITPTSAKFTATFIADSSSSEPIARFVKLEIDGEEYKLTKVTTSSTVIFTKNLTGLLPNTEYSWKATLGWGYEENPNWLNVTDSGSFTTLSGRPSEFSWTYEKVSGEDFNLTAQEWNDFTSKINEFRNYRDLSDYNFTKAYKGNEFTAGMYNEARLAIQDISGYGTYIPTVYSGNKITAYAMNIIVSELNVIP